jgi:hypothetical protein
MGGATGHGRGISLFGTGGTKSGSACWARSGPRKKKGRCEAFLHVEKVFCDQFALEC